MKLEKKIFLDKNDDLDKAVGQLVAAEAEKVILNIPKSSVLAVSVHNFQVLERESETAGKELAIESVDEHVLELASLATIPAVNPVFKVRERAVADILPSESEESKVEEKPAKKPRAKKIKTKTEEPEPAVKGKPKRAVRKKKESAEEIMPIIVKEKEKPAVPETFEEVIPKHEFKYEEEKEKPVHRRPKRGKRFWITTALVPVVLVAGYFAAAYFLPMVTINISIQKTTVSFSYSVIVSTAANMLSVNGNMINLPGQLSVAGGDKSNLSMNFPATGSSTVSTKASGTLTVNNNYSAQAQILVANTRFQSPDGKIFRLVQKTTVPGAKVSGGKITPSSIDVKVVADQTGADYNVPPSQNWQIPGFSGTPRYEKFYAEAKTSMTGGASSNQIMPTKDDIVQGKVKIESTLLDVLKSKTLILNSQNLKILDNASSFSVTREDISSQVDKDGNFSIFAVGEFKQLGFDESMLKEAIIKSVATSTTDVKIDDFSISYATSTADLVNGKMAFSVSGTLVYEPKIDFDAFKKNIAGLDADSLKTSIFALPGLQKANISFWPFWVNSVPTHETRVNMVVE